MTDYFENLTAEHFIGRSCKECYSEYVKWCVENGCDVMYTPGFGKTVHERYGLISKQKRVPGGKVRIYVKTKEK